MPNRTAVIQTNKGTIKFELLEEDAPKTTENFRLLAEKGYYDGIIFHRVHQRLHDSGRRSDRHGPRRRVGMGRKVQ